MDSMKAISKLCDLLIELAKMTQGLEKRIEKLEEINAKQKTTKSS